MRTFHLWGPRILWALFGLATCFALYNFGSAYTYCRSGDLSNVLCFFVALIVAYFRLLIFAMASLVHLLQLILP